MRLWVSVGLDGTQLGFVDLAPASDFDVSVSVTEIRAAVGV
jgi:hypothetical protein